MARVQHRRVSERGELAQALVHGVGVTTGEVRSTAAGQEQRVSRNEPPVDEEALASRCVTRGVKQFHFDGTDRHTVAAVMADNVPGIQSGDPADRQHLLPVGVDRNGGFLEKAREAFDVVTHHGTTHMVGVVVGCEHPDDVDPIAGRNSEDVVHRVGRVHDQGLRGHPVADEIREIHHLTCEPVASGVIPSGEKLPKVQPVVVVHPPDPSPSAAADSSQRSCEAGPPRIPARPTMRKSCGIVADTTMLPEPLGDQPARRGGEGKDHAMPAVTVEDLSKLAKVDAGPPARSRELKMRTSAPSGFEGEGFPVRRAFAGVPVEALDPFVHMDQMGEVEYAPGEPKGTPWHPHRGFETVTYMIDGTFEHHDSNGGGGVITNGDTQWMTAGKGILHIERPPEALVASGGLFHGIQLWVNLPSALKMVDPRYQDIRSQRLALFGSPDGGALVRLIAGDLQGASGPGITHTPITMVHATLSAGARLSLPWDPGFNSLVYALAGSGSIGPKAAPLHTGQLCVLGDGDFIEVRADGRIDGPSQFLDLLFLGGRPIKEPVAHYGPFVMNTREELAQAFEDFQHGRMGVIPAH